MNTRNERNHWTIVHGSDQISLRIHICQKRYTKRAHSVDGGHSHWLGHCLIETANVRPGRGVSSVEVDGTQVGLQGVLRLTHVVVQESGGRGIDGIRHMLIK